MEEQKVESKPVLHPSRQQMRDQKRKAQKDAESMRKEMHSNVTRGEMYQVIESFNKLRDRMFHLDIFSAALEKILIDKNLITREEIEAAFEFEGKRAAMFNEISKQEGNYVARLEICKKWNIDPSVTNIPDQMLADKELTEEARMTFAIDYNITRLIEIEENRKKIEAKVEEGK